ncbi:MAG: VOC family protein [Rhizobiales bacterium]|nr:VOC family protein [Hyphomicrobiales bacterium]
MPDASLFSHVTVGTNDLERAKTFYNAVLEPLGGVQTYGSDVVSGYGLGPGGQTVFWVVLPFDRQVATVGNGTHIAFNANNRAAVDAFHALALANGGADEGPPGLRPHYHADYYGAYVRDLDGNKLQAVCHLPA